MEKNPTMFDDKKGKDTNEQQEKQFKFIDKRKFSEDFAEGQGDNAPTEDKGINTVYTNDQGINKTEDAVNETSGNAVNMEEPSEMPAFEADFATFVYSLNTQALLFLGKIPNPMTGKYERDVNMAKYLIDTIDMLSKKTAGNLDENEKKLVENILYDLRMAYISEKK
jgi:hypothetical protein